MTEKAGREVGGVLRTVLIDDNADLRLLTRMFLEGESVEIVGEAADGLSALDLIDEVHPDVAIVDIHMPGLSGVELIRFLTGRAAGRTRLVAYSADASALAEAMQVGAHAAVLKTGDSSDLLVALCA